MLVKLFALNPCSPPPTLRSKHQDLEKQGPCDIDGKRNTLRIIKLGQFRRLFYIAAIFNRPS